MYIKPYQYVFVKIMLDYICIISMIRTSPMGLLWLYLVSSFFGHILIRRGLLASIFLLLYERPRSEFFISR